jgi:thiamine biosynthesis lipoprotein
MHEIRFARGIVIHGATIYRRTCLDSSGRRTVAMGFRATDHARMIATRKQIAGSAAAFAAAFATGACTPTAPSLQAVTGNAQGTTYSLQWTGGATEAEAIALAAESELERLDALLSNYRPDSVIERFNATRSTEPQLLSAELVALLALAKEVHAASSACFDPTVRPLVRAWGFDGDEPEPPPIDAIEALRANVGLDKLLILDAERVRKVIPELEIDMSSIGQGYTAERLASVVEEHGVLNYLTEIGGEIVARGTRPNGTRWRIGVENPAPGGGPGPALRMPAEGRTAIVTSGTYRHYFDDEGRRFSHIVDPRTGAPVEHDLVAVTVIARSGALAAAWGTALLCLGPEPGAAAAERENVAAFFWEQQGAAVTLTRSTALATEWRSVLD